MDITLLVVLISCSTFTYGLNPPQIPATGFFNPMNNGGSLLTKVNDTFPPGQAEPLNIIISGNSDPRVLVNSQTNGGLLNLFLSYGFAGECLGQHSGSPQQANLGDGHGLMNETAESRWDYGNAQLGTCTETVQGGDHFRYWRQNGPQGNSSAVFLAASYELPLEDNHDIVVNGYNLGRDWLIGNITKSVIPTQNLTNGSTFTGTTSSNNYTYSSQITYFSGLLQNTSIGINHNATVGVNGTNAIDGLVAVIDVKITGAPRSFAWKHSPPQLSTLFVIIAIASLPTLIVS